ncbi:Ent-copalyl diphosphate synthase, chloroplastic-like protein, partial [Tanacetum coccineum]
IRDKIDMKYIISPPPLRAVAITNTFRHGFSRTATFPSAPPLTQLFHSFTGMHLQLLLCYKNYQFKEQRYLQTGQQRYLDYETSNYKSHIKWMHVLQSDLLFVYDQHATAEDDLDIIDSTPAFNSHEILAPKNDINEYIKVIKSAFDSMEDGVISPSAYDTAWVALIEDGNGPGGGPRFPSSLQWVVNHQLRDGSWGDPLMFSACDRIINTLACVIALSFWNMHPDKCKKGLEFVDKYVNKLKEEKDEHMTIGFEIIFPVLIELA